MIRKYYIQIGLAVAVIGILAYSFSGSPDFHDLTQKSFEDYKNGIINGADRLVLEENRDGFDFFTPEKKWVIEAEFIPENSGREFEMLMTDSTTEVAQLKGVASFKFENSNVKVLIFEEEASYLLPFKDLTNGKTTYGGGRYINLPKEALKGDKLEIDFNRARNYYCAYTEQYICPVPPPENSLKIAVEAGEKIFKKK
ncbi:MAG: DUF1684 domain-containing protein [Cytophagaceae bacterium]|nr:DUF1684 domain-containing protein [Cytophagaceae bacterium]